MRSGLKGDGYYFSKNRKQTDGIKHVGVGGFQSVISLCMDLNSDYVFIKRQKQSVLIDLFCELYFIMYNIGK